MTDEMKAGTEARARMDLKFQYERGEASLKDYADAVRLLTGVWLQHRSEAQVETFVCDEIAKLDFSAIAE